MNGGKIMLRRVGFGDTSSIANQMQSDLTAIQSYITAAMSGGASTAVAQSAQTALADLQAQITALAAAPTAPTAPTTPTTQPTTPGPGVWVSAGVASLAAAGAAVVGGTVGYFIGRPKRKKS
jgi:hypothetical protein